MKSKLFVAFVLFSFCLAFVQSTPASEPMKALIVDGQMNKWHPEKRRASFVDLAQSVGSWAGAGWAD